MFVVTEADADAIRAVFNQEESCRPLSSCAGGSQGSPTTRKRGRAPEHCWVEAAASPTIVGDAAAFPQGR